MMLLKQLNCGVQIFYVYYIGKTPLFLNLYFFFCGLVKKGWALKVAVQFAARGLVAYKSVAYKKISVFLYISLKIYF